MLFWQEDNDGDLHANLIDWGVVEFHREDKKTPGEKRVQAYVRDQLAVYALLIVLKIPRPLRLIIVEKRT